MAYQVVGTHWRLLETIQLPRPPVKSKDPASQPYRPSGQPGGRQWSGFQFRSAPGRRRLWSRWQTAPPRQWKWGVACPVERPLPWSTCTTFVCCGFTLCFYTDWVKSRPRFTYPHFDKILNQVKRVKAPPPSSLYLAHRISVALSHRERSRFFFIYIYSI